jgi:Zn-dependent protease with chaperone function
VTASVVLPLLAVGVAVALGVSSLLLWPAQLLLRRRRYISPSVWAGLVLAPIAIGLLVITALLLPAPLGACHCAAHAPHHPHLCWVHPQLALPLMLPAALFLGSWALLAAPPLWRVLADARATARWARKVSERMISADGVPVWLASCGGPIAVSAGVLKPRIVFDHGLWSRLNDEERRAIVLHEHAHGLRGDGLTLLALRLAAAACLVPIATRCIEGWRAAAELACDRHASSAIGDPLAVASTLLSVERECERSMHTPAQGALAARPGALLELRVRALLEPERYRAAGLANDLLLFGSALCTAAFLVLVWPSDGVHHGVETLIGWAFH